MCKKLAFLVCVIVVLGLVGKASAAPVAYRWTNLGGNDLWRNAANWDPSTGWPGEDPNDTADLEELVRGPIINTGSLITVASIDGPDPPDGETTTVDITGGTLTVKDGWGLDGDSTGTTIINIGGTSIVRLLGGPYSLRGMDQGTTIVNITDSPDIYTQNQVKGGDNTGELSPCYFSMAGGDFNSAGLDLQHSDGAWCTITGGTMILRNNGLNIPWGSFTLDGGAYVEINGEFRCPGEDEAPITSVVSLDNGTLICNGFDADGNDWSLDIEEPVTWTLRGHHKDSIQPHIDEGRITGKNGTEVPGVVEYTEDGQPYTRVGFNLVQKEASNPSPDDGAPGICPNGVTLTWTAGQLADQHKIFFGTSWDDVNEMTDPCATNNVGNETYQTGWLEYGRTYFWRVDEVNVPPDPCAWRGTIWRFSTPSGKASDPSPADGQRGAPPDSILTWTPPCWATGQTLYFGTDMPERIVLLEDDFEDGFDPNWAVTTNWSPYNATGDSNFAPRDANLAKATSGPTATLESGALDARFANAVDVRIYVRRTEDITADELKLYYYNGSSYDVVNDFNVVALGPNDTWLYFGDTITDSQYLTNNFGIKLVANITGGTVYIDDVRVRNTWPVDPNWWEADLGGADNNYAPALSSFKHYYWRIDTNDGNNIFQGDYWDFTTGVGGLIMYYKFDGGGGFPDPINADESYDTVAFEHDVGPGGSMGWGESNPVIAASTASADFDPCVGLKQVMNAGENDPLRLAGYQYTVEFWVKPENLDSSLDVEEPDDDEPDLWLDDEFDLWLIGKFDSWRIAIKNPGGDDDANQFHWDFGNSEREGTAVEGQWTHLAAVYDETVDDDDKLSLYVDGELVSSVETGRNPSDNNYPVTIGYAWKDDVNKGRYFDGLIDEVRIYDIALTPCDFLLIPGPEWASCPSPYDGEVEVDPCTVVLMWTRGQGAVDHEIYFSSNFSDVNSPGATPVLTSHAPNSWTPPETPAHGAIYYWRIDTSDGSPPLYQGPVWQFTTEYVITDANLILHYKFDESSGDDAIDSSGHNYHGDVDDADWDPADGRFDGCLDFDDDTSVEPPRTATTHLTNQVSISVWLNIDSDANNTVLDVSTGSDANYAMRVLVPDGSGDVLWRAGNDSCDVLLWDTATPDGWEGDWHHFVFIKDEVAGTMKIYFDTELVKEKEGAISSLSNIVGKPFFIGDHAWSTSEYEGKMDDLRIYDYAIPKSKVDELFRGGELGIAWGPSPYDGQPDAHPTSDLSWSPGDYASSHEVYLGTNKQRVTDANNDANYWPDVYRGKQDPCTYEPGTLDLGTWYYWRIDEVNDPNNDRWKGNIWRFRVAPYIIIDNFDDDTMQDPPQNDWYNGTAVTPATGAQITLRSTPPVIGEHSMRYVYNNWMDWGWGYYSETQTISLEPNDWDYYDVKTISLWFYGKSGNAATIYEQMNLGLEDDANYAVVLYGALAGEEMTDVQVEDWQLWEVLTNRFTNINFRDVKKICIGFGFRNNVIDPGMSSVGTVFFDEINLFVPTCMPDINPLEGDLNRDCTADWQDVEIMADDWLEADVNLNPVQAPGEANLVAWWKLDEAAADTNIATDYAGYDNNGVIETLGTNVFWADAGHDGNALRFDGGRVLVPDANALKPKYEVTVCAWVKYYYSHDESARIVVKGADNKETFGLEISNEDDVCVFLVRDGNNPGGDYEKYDVNTWPLEYGDWTHLAGTFKQGDCIKIYVNGQLEATNNDANAVTYLSQDTDDLAIGNRSDATDRAFEGLIDDVRVYNRALSAAEIAYIATDETGIFTVQSVANLYNDETLGDRAVNLRDFAKLAENWLVRKLWPE